MVQRSAEVRLDAPVVVRAYRASDRARVREIAYLTGYMGEPAWYWRDVPSFADIWSAWYTDVEPESAFVAEREGSVVGYLLGCVDTARAPAPAGLVVRQMLRRLLLVRPGTAGFFWRAAGDTLRGSRAPAGDLRDPRWPAHLHTNLLPEARGVGAGAALMRAWLARLADLGVPGCHLVTLAENRNAIGFFRHMGFRVLGPPQRVPGMRTREGERMHQQIMVREIPGVRD